MKRIRSRRALAFALLSTLASASALAQTPQQPATKEAQSLPTLAPLVESVKSAVVNVDVQARVPDQGGEALGNPFEEFFGGGQGNRRFRQPRGQVRAGMGSGFIIDPKGLVLTNNHVVQGAINIRVKLEDGRNFDAQVVGRDPLTDIALIRLKGKVENLPVVKLGDSDQLRVGDWAVAIGNPFGLASSVSLGIISARARTIGAGPYDEFLQTDAAINPGNSGGPLFNMKGEVIGINTAIVGGGTGIGFAVPSNMVKALVPYLEKEGGVTRGWLGIVIQDLTPELAKALKVPANEGAIVSSVNDGSPAAKAGLKSDDVVVAIDGTKISSGNGLTKTVALKRPGTTSTMTLFRNGKQVEVKVQLGTRPDIEGVGQTGPDRQEGEEASTARVGLAFQSMDPRVAQRTGLPAQGAVITEVVPASPAERAELSPGMVVTEAGGKPVKTAEDLSRAIKGAPAGSVVLLRIQVPGGGGKALRALTVP